MGFQEAIAMGVKNGMTDLLWPVWLLDLLGSRRA